MTIRFMLRPGDIGTIVYLHGTIYAREHGFDPTLEAYVAGPLDKFVLAASPRERLWIAQREGAIVGSIAIVDAGGAAAQLRWFLVDPTARGSGLGSRLLDEAIQFSSEQRHTHIILWTVSALSSAAHLHGSRGFRRTEATPRRLWGVETVEEKYELELGPTPRAASPYR